MGPKWFPKVVKKWQKRDRTSTCFLDAFLEWFWQPATLKNKVFHWRVCTDRLFTFFSVRSIFDPFLRQKRLHFWTFCPLKRHPKNKRIPSDPHWPLEDPFELPWGPFRTLEGSLGDLFGPFWVPRHQRHCVKETSGDLFWWPAPPKEGRRGHLAPY